MKVETPRIKPNHDALAKRWMVFANHVLFKSTLSARDRGIVIPRIGWLCQDHVF